MGVTQLGFMTEVFYVGSTKNRQAANYDLQAGTLHQAAEVFKTFMKRHSISNNLYRGASSTGIL